MASKTTITFNDVGVVDQTIQLTSNIIYTFKGIRQALRQVDIGADGVTVGSNFKDAFNVDDNYLGAFTLTYEAFVKDPNGDPNFIPYSILTIEHPDNTFFDALVNNTTFATISVTTTTQEVAETLDVTLSASATDTCGKYKIGITTNVNGGKVVIKNTAGTKILEYTPDGTLYETELLRPATAETYLVELYKNATDTDPALYELYNPPTVLSIRSVTIEGTPFGGFATINATLRLDLEYSLNGTDWKSSNVWGGLLAGNFTAYARDNFGCTATRQFVITEEQASGLTVPPFMLFPKHNCFPMYDRNQNNFLGMIAEETGITYAIDYLQEDRIRLQFKSSYKTHTAKLYGCGSEETLSIIQKSDNINRVNIYEGNYTDKNGRLAVYFTSGNIYNQDMTPKAEGHVLNGFLPSWYESGIYLNIEGVGVTKIDYILEEDDINYAVTSENASGTVLGVPITSIHSADNYERFEFEIDFNKPEGNYILELTYPDGQLVSEVIRVSESLPEQYLKVSWWNENLNDQLFYQTGIKPFRRIKWDQYFTYIGQNEREIHQTDTSIKLIRSKSKAVYELSFRPTPMEVAHGMIDGLNHASHIDINGAVFICNSAAKPENFGKWYFVKTELALIGQSVESIEADLSQINVQFLKVKEDAATGVGFLQV